MHTRKVSLPLLGLIAGTRLLMGLGIGILIADQLRPDRKRAVGLTLLGIGIFSSAPLAERVFRRERDEGQAAEQYEEALREHEEAIGHS